MKKTTHWVLLLTLMVAGGIGPSTAASAAEESAAGSRDRNEIESPITDYVIGPGDILEISVWKEPDLTKSVTVLPDGKIAFPLIGQIAAEGLTLAQLRETIEQKILRFVPNPNLSVAVQQINSLQIYVVGKVLKPGRFELNTNVNVLQALAMAGGLNPFAKKTKIKIFRRNAGQDLIFEFDYEEVSKGRELEQNIRLKRGDVIVVP